MLESQIYGVLAAILTAGSAAVWFLRQAMKGYAESFGGEMGKIEAAEKKLSSVLNQLAATTRTVEDIKEEISNRQESSRIRREKLEQLYQSTSQLNKKISRMHSELTVGRLQPVEITEEIDRMDMLVELYFKDQRDRLFTLFAAALDVNGAHLQAFAQGQQPNHDHASVNSLYVRYRSADTNFKLSLAQTAEDLFSLQGSREGQGLRP